MENEAGVKRPVLGSCVNVPEPPITRHVAIGDSAVSCGKMMLESDSESVFATDIGLSVLDSAVGGTTSGSHGKSMWSGVSLDSGIMIWSGNSSSASNSVRTIGLVAVTWKCLLVGGRIMGRRGASHGRQGINAVRGTNSDP